MRSFPFKTYLPYLVIASVGLLVFCFYFSPMLYYDDWLNVGYYYYNHRLPWISPHSSRLFVYTALELLITLFGFAPGPILFSNIIIRITSALWIYQIHKEIRPTRTDIGLAFALLTLIYPADKTRMWMVQIVLGWPLGCFSAWLLYRYYRSGKIWLLLISTLGYTYAFLEYEAPLGILTAWGLLLMLYTFPPFTPPGRRISWLRWAGLATPLVLFCAYLFYRLQLIHLIGIVGFHPIAYSDPLSPIHNLAAGARALGYAWIEPLHALVPGLPILLLMSGALSLLAICFLLGWRWSTYLARRHGWLAVTADERHKAIWQPLFTCAAGWVLCVAGYFPAITFEPPGLEFFYSRLNAYALVGASLLLVGLADLLTWAVVRYTRQAAFIFSLFILPFIVIGAGSELVMQHQAQLLWQEYRQMWQGIFRAAPGIQDDTSVVLVISHTPCHPDNYGERPYFIHAVANREFNKAFNAFYGTKKIIADFIYQGCDLPYQAVFNNTGYYNSPSSRGFLSDKRVVVLIYDRQTHQVNLVKNLVDITGFDVPEYHPHKWLTSRPGPNQMRYLVEP